MYSIYSKLKVAFKNYINQICLNALNSNKLRNSDHFGSFVSLNIQPVCFTWAAARCPGKVTIYYHVAILRLHFKTRECHSSFWLETTLLLKSQWAYSQMEPAVVALPLMILCLLSHKSRYKTGHTVSIRTNTITIHYWKHQL